MYRDSIWYNSIIHNLYIYTYNYIYARLGHEGRRRVKLVNKDVFSSSSEKSAGCLEEGRIHFVLAGRT